MEVGVVIIAGVGHSLLHVCGRVIVREIGIFTWCGLMGFKCVLSTGGVVVGNYVGVLVGVFSNWAFPFSNCLHDTHPLSQS